MVFRKHESRKISKREKHIQSKSSAIKECVFHWLKRCLLLKEPVTLLSDEVFFEGYQQRHRRKCLIRGLEWLLMM